MSERNKTHSEQTHRIFISSSKSTTNRTRLYIILLLLFLLFILIFYLFYNFISFKRYSSSQKKKKKESMNLYLSSKNQPKRNSILYEELTIPIPTYQIISDL